VFDYSEAVNIVLQFGIMFLAVTMCLCLFRAVKGPRLADRIIAVNMICVKTILLIVLVGVNRDEVFLMDIALVYALLSFLAIVVLTKFMLNVKLKRQRKAAAEALSGKEV